MGREKSVKEERGEKETKGKDEGRLLIAQRRIRLSVVRIKIRIATQHHSAAHRAKEWDDQQKQRKDSSHMRVYDWKIREAHSRNSWAALSEAFELRLCTQINTRP